MKNVIVCAQFSSVDQKKWDDFLRDAKADKELPTGVQTVFYTSWILDAHNNAEFLASLVYSAKFHSLPLVVFDLQDSAPVLQVGEYSVAVNPTL